MSNECDNLSKFRNAFLDYLEGIRDAPPAVIELPQEQRPAAESFVSSIMAARGVDPYASRPSIQQLLASRSPILDQADELGGVLQNHLRNTIDYRAIVAPDAAAAAFGLASACVVQALGMRIRVVPEPNSTDLATSLSKRAGDIAKVFSAFPDSHAVLYTTTELRPRAVIVDRGDAQGAIETPSGEMRAPRLRRSITDAGTACENWLRGLIPEFQHLATDLLPQTANLESPLDTYQLASRVVYEVSAAGARARIEAKRGTWRSFGDQEARQLAEIVVEAQLGQLSEEGYRSRIDELVGVVA